MPSRFILDEFDVDLSPLTSRLVIVIVIVVSSLTDARTLDASSVAVAIASQRVISTFGLVDDGILDVGHDSTRLADFCCWFGGLGLGMAGSGKMLKWEVCYYWVGLEMKVLVKCSSSRMEGSWVGRSGDRVRKGERPTFTSTCTQKSPATRNAGRCCDADKGVAPGEV